jgi:transposase
VKAAIQSPPEEVGVNAPDWNWKGVQAFIRQRFGRLLCRSSCLNYLHRLGFVLKRPKKRLSKASAEKREAFVAFYAGLREWARRMGTKIFFVDEAHFRADADLRGKWVLRGQPALVDSTSPRLGEKATYYSAVCLETGEVESMEPEGNCTAESSAAFLGQLRASHKEPLIVIWDNGPAHRGQPIRDFLAMPDQRMLLISLPGYSPDFNADEAIWDWVREEVTANLCLGSKEKVRERAGAFFQDLRDRTAEVRRRCRTALQARADALGEVTLAMLSPPIHVDSTVALV